ncbi:MAG: alpha-E domain-containing protein [Chloroflexi bacterium]|nr:alpha-E domain-containing protein [Chloroflexota bacterium]
MPLLCRVAENMFWLNRYVERAIAIIRIVDVTAHLELDSGEPDAEGVDLWMPLLGPSIASAPREATDEAPGPLPQDVRYYLAFDPDNPGSLVSCIRHARGAARQVRDSISSEMWEQINTSYLMLGEPDRVRDVEEDLHAFYRRVRDNLLLIQGLADVTVAHDEAWQFLSLGTYLERADNVSGLLRLHCGLLTSGSVTTSGDDTVRWLAVLRSAGSAEAYARYYSLRVEPTRVLEFLLLNPLFPQSVRYSLSAAWEALESISTLTTAGSGPPVRSLGMLRARLEHTSVDEVLESGLAEFLGGIQDDIALVSERLTRAFFRYAPPPHRDRTIARAAQIMAAQQQ